MQVLGADVDALDELGRTFEQESRRLLGSVTAIDTTMRSTWWSGLGATRFESDWRRMHASTVRGVAQLLADASRSLSAQSKQQRHASDGEDFLSAFVVGAPVDRRPFSQLSPLEKVAFLRALPASEREAFARAHAREIATLDGAPVDMRDAANRQLIRDEIAHERSELRKLMVLGLFGGFSIMGPQLAARIYTVQHHIDVLNKAVSNTDYMILKFDPTGDGKVIAVYGDLEHATNVAVLVPGVSNSGYNALDGGNVMHDAHTLYTKVGPHTAVVAWIDYDAPDNALVAESSAAADAGAPALRQFVSSVRDYGAQSITVVAHSYGSVLAGHAARDGQLDANNVVFIGSPGTGVNHASDLNLAPGGQVYAGHNYGDPIGIANIKGADVFGPDPASSSYGAKSIETNWPSLNVLRNHGYYHDGDDSLTSIAKIVDGGS